MATPEPQAASTTKRATRCHPTSLCASGWGQAIRRFLCQHLCKRQQREQRGELSAGARWVWRRYLGAAAETGWGPEPPATSWGKYKGAGEAGTCDIPTRLTLRPGQSLPVWRSCWEWSHIDQDGDPGGKGRRREWERGTEPGRLGESQAFCDQLLRLANRVLSGRKTRKPVLTHPSHNNSDMLIPHKSEHPRRS